MKPEQTSSPKLARAVIRQLGGIESLENIARHGPDAGFPGFTYYADTVSFFKRHRGSIRELVKERARDFGEEPLAMVAGFNCLKPTDDETRESIARCLYGGRLKDEDRYVANALAWFAAEEMAREMCPDA